ncbi:MAG: choice-of-anchor A family protein [Sphingomonadaceae bacterium]|nr:choice-of-anchor A family protein [Sphingomonadaceae bacterium]
MTSLIKALLLSTALLSSAGAEAATLSAADAAAAQAILSQFNLVTRANLNANNETEGPIAIGGNFNAGGPRNVGFNNNGTVYAPVVGGKTYGVANVFGNVSGGINPQNGSGNIFIGGNTNGTFQNLNNAVDVNVVGNGAGSQISNARFVRTAAASFAGQVQNTPAQNIRTGLPATSVFPFGDFNSAIGQPLLNLTTFLASLPGTQGVNAQALPGGTQNLNFTANTAYRVNGKNYGVITTTLANFATNQNLIGIGNGSNDATFVIVSGNTGNTLPTLNGNVDETRVIFVFPEATTLNFNGQWFGSILAPLATINQRDNLTGSFFFNSLTQGAELHWTSGRPGNANNYGFRGDLSGLPTGNITPGRTPTPAATALLGLGAAGLIAARRRRAA